MFEGRPQLRRWLTTCGVVTIVSGIAFALFNSIVRHFVGPDTSDTLYRIVMTLYMPGLLPVVMVTHNAHADTTLLRYLPLEAVSSGLFWGTFIFGLRRLIDLARAPREWKTDSRNTHGEK